MCERVWTLPLGLGSFFCAYYVALSGDAINAVLAAAGYNFRVLLRWLKFLLFRILIALSTNAELESA
jgi:hypothetical protein